MAATALSTDLYQLTMMAGYFAAGRHEAVSASFELFVRRMPPHRNYLIAAGLESVLDFLEDLHFTSEQLAWIRDQPAMRSAPDGFFEYLRQVRFSGEVWAVTEGTPVFPKEPLVRAAPPRRRTSVVPRPHAGAATRAPRDRPDRRLRRGTHRRAARRHFLSVFRRAFCPALLRTIPDATQASARLAGRPLRPIFNSEKEGGS